MQKKISSIPFSGTPEQEAKLKESIARHIDDPGAVMPVLQEAQEIYGYLPIEVQTMVAEGLSLLRASTTSPFASAQPATLKAPATFSTRFPTSSVSALRSALRTVSSRSQPAAASARAVWLPSSPSTRTFTAD